MNSGNHTRSLFTPLPPSPLRSDGAGLQESLHHYALRLADQCCLSLERFERFLLRDDPRQAKAGNAIFPSSWIGPRSNFRTLLDALKRDTGVDDLFAGTFHAVTEVMGRGGTRRRQIRGEGRAWCPGCYAEWDDRTSSEPLIWSFDMLSACPIHQMLLETRCRGCDASQGFSVRYRDRRKCQYCKSSLGHLNGRTEEDKQRKWVNHTLRRFTEWIQEARDPVSKTRYDEFTRMMLKSHSTGESRLPRAVYICASSKRSVPTITSLLNLAAFQGTTIQGLLCEPPFAASKNLFDDGSRFQGLLFKRRDLRPAHRRVTFALATLSESGRPLPPPSAVWLAFGLWCSLVRDICPSEHGRFKELFDAQRVHLPAQRFKSGVAICLRLLEKSDGESKLSALVKHLMGINFTEQGAIDCAAAASNLYEVVRLSNNEECLAQFEAAKVSSSRQWAMNANTAARE